MPLREFTDSAGKAWRAWDTYPVNAGETHGKPSALERFMANQPVHEGMQPAGVRPRFQSGWLTFACGDERRRLAPVPAGWEGADEETLKRYLLTSEQIDPSVSPPRTPKKDRS